jgi:glycosyltransferase involved in cell wall biosynthesis
MAAASAVVATAVGGTPEIVDGTTGVLVRPRDPQALAHAITTVALDDERRAKLAAAGRRRVEAHFTIDRMVDQYARAYRQLLG